jgi:GNAT superfamily N-acetyltransferase
MAIVTIAEASEVDIADVTDLMAQYWAFEGIAGFEPVRIGALLRRFVARPELGRCWLARRDEAPSGYLIACFVFSFEYGGLMAEIDELFVAPGLRRSGLGAGLLAAAEAEFQRLGCVRVGCQVGQENEAARAFYARHGYAHRSGFMLLNKRLLPANEPLERAGS